MNPIKSWKNTIGLDELTFKFLKGSHRDQSLVVDKLNVSGEKFVGQLFKDNKSLYEEYEFEFAELMEEIDAGKVEVFVKGDNVTEVAIEFASEFLVNMEEDEEDYYEEDDEEDKY